MSYNNPGYVPPPPPTVPARRSPWVYFGVGCGVLVLLMGGCTAVMVGKFAKEMKKPWDMTAHVKAMGDIPIYPNAKPDEIMSRTQEIASLPFMKARFPSDKSSLMAYQISEAPTKVADWYAAQMEKRGFEEGAGTNVNVAGQDVHQAQYVKENEAVLVQAQKSPRNEGETILVLMRFTGYHGKAKK